MLSVLPLLFTLVQVLMAAPASEIPMLNGFTSQAVNRGRG
jgi:hypothetical protein